MYLVDTVVLSELRKRSRDANVVKWIGSVAAADLFLSTITIAEIERGIERQRTANPAFAEELAQWLDIILRVYAERVLPLTVNVARRWGRLAAQIGNTELDLAIAATALEHGLIVATRNTSDFAPTGVATLNPFDAHPARPR
jgi:predicted nucleic acid-binding protein